MNNIHSPSAVPAPSVVGSRKTRGATRYCHDTSGDRGEAVIDGYKYDQDYPTLIRDTSQTGNALFAQGSRIVPGFRDVVT